jgi:transcriptional regulator with XRE-family HTH domain
MVAGEKGLRVRDLKAWRLRATLSQEDLAEKADVSRATIVRGEAGGTLSFGNIRKLAAALGITVDELRFGEPEEPRPKSEPAAA